MAATASQFPQQTGRRRPLKRDSSEDRTASSDFRKKYGLPGSGKLPLPPADHPEAKAFARAVLRRAGSVQGVPAHQVAERVRQARKILGLPAKPAKEANEPGETIHASFRKKYGLAPSGPGPHPPSAYKLPLPPSDHPQAYKFAKAVLSRAHAVTGLSPAKVAARVARAKAIVAKHERKTEAAVKPWREAAWLDLRTHLFVEPREGELLEEFRRRNPSAVLADRVSSLTEAQREAIAARRPVRQLQESISGTGGYEHVRLAEAAADPITVVNGTLLIRSGPGNLGDRNYYTPAALIRAVESGVFKGACAYFDHSTPTEDREQPGRSVRRMAGWYDNFRTDDYDDPELGRRCTGLFADFHPKVGDHEIQSIIRTCAEYAQANPGKQFVGLSIDAEGVGEPDKINGEPWTRIDEITRVRSIDLVTRAGAGGAILARAA